MSYRSLIYDTAPRSRHKTLDRYGAITSESAWRRASMVEATCIVKQNAPVLEEIFTTAVVLAACTGRIRLLGFQYQQHHMFMSALLPDLPFISTASTTTAVYCSNVHMPISLVIV